VRQHEGGTPEATLTAKYPLEHNDDKASVKEQQQRRSIRCEEPNDDGSIN
jgi:hypothetical protein